MSTSKSKAQVPQCAKKIGDGILYCTRKRGHKGDCWMDPTMPAALVGPSPSVIIEGIGLKGYQLNVQQVNNLVRYLFTSGWISHTRHAEVHVILDDMIKWLEGQGIKVNMDMEKM